MEIIYLSLPESLILRQSPELEIVLRLEEIPLESQCDSGDDGVEGDDSEWIFI